MLLLQFVVEIYIGTFKDKASTLETMEFYNSVVEQISSILILETTEDGFNLPEVGNFRGFGNALPLYECDPGTLMDYRTMSCGKDIFIVSKLSFNQLVYGTPF